MNQQDYKTVSALKKQVDALTVALRETEQLLAASRGMFKAADEEIKRLREQMESDACRRSAENASRDMNDSLRE